MRKKITSVLIIVLCMLMAVPWGVFAQAVNAEKGAEQTQQQTTTPAPIPTPEITAPAAEPTPKQPAETPADQPDASVSTMVDYLAGRAVLDTGENVNMTLRKLSGDPSHISYSNSSIKTILRSGSPAPSDVTTENLSVSNVPVTAWWDSSSETIYWYSQDPKPMLNADSSSMFYKLEALTRVDLSHFDTSNVTNMHSMFYHCDGLTSLDVSHFDTSNVTNMAYMFYYCIKLTDLDLSHFDTSKVTHMYSMFNSCKRLAKLDVSSFDTSKVIYFDGVFENCEKLKTIYASDKFTTANIDKSIRYTYENMFKNCTALVGGNGTAYSELYTDINVACIDKPGQLGYFTQNGATPIPAAGQNVNYNTHVQNVGWQPYVKSGNMAGTSNRSLRLEAMHISLQNQKYNGGIEYRTHIQNIGWETEWKSNGSMSGTSNQGLRLEAMQVRLTGEMAKHYDVYYRVHAQNFGWLNWAKNGEQSGTAGYGYRLEGMQIMLVDKGGAAPAIAPNSQQDKPFVEKYKDDVKADSLIAYQTHVQNVGWQNYAVDGGTAGTSGLSYRLEGMKINLNNPKYSGDIEYRTHIQNIGWENEWKKNDVMSGTSGQALRLEAMQVKLTGEMANHYDVYYRVHAQNFGWLGWAKNGEESGTAGYGYRLEAMQIVLVAKGMAMPSGSPASNRSEAFIQQTLEEREYNPIIEKYNHAIVANYTISQLDNEKLSDKVYRYFYGGSANTSRSLGYALMDLDGDATRELLIGEVGKPEIFDMYTIKNGQAERLFYSHGRSYYNYADGNKILHDGSGGAETHSWYLYEYNKDLIEIDGAKSEGGYQKTTRYYVFDNGVWRQTNQSEFTSKYQALSQLKKNYEVTLFPASSK